MSRLCAVTGIALLMVLAGCAAADPTGGAFGEPIAAAKRERPKCPPGQMLTCEARSPNRVSDGRYGFRGGSSRMQRCSCQEESDILDLGQRTLPTEPR